VIQLYTPDYFGPSDSNGEFGGSNGDFVQPLTCAIVQKNQLLCTVFGYEMGGMLYLEQRADGEGLQLVYSEAGPAVGQWPLVLVAVAVAADTIVLDGSS